MLRFFYVFSLCFFIFANNAKAADCKISVFATNAVKNWTDRLDFEIEGCKIDGELKDDPGYVYGEFSAVLETLDTGVDMRNNHMKDNYLEVKKYPLIKFTLDKTAYGAKIFTGKLTLHGVTTEIKGEVVSASVGKFEARFDILVTDFGIKKPEYKGLGLNEAVKVHVTLP